MFYVFCLATIANLWDLITTILIGHGESNPIFALFGNSVIPLILFKIFMGYTFWWVYNIKLYKTNFIYYSVISILVFVTALMFVAAISNTYALTQPDIIAKAATMSTTVKLQGYSMFVSLGYVLPMIFNLLCFWIYEKTRKNIMVVQE